MGMRATRMTMKRMEEKKLKVSQSLIVYLFVLKMKFFFVLFGLLYNEQSVPPNSEEFLLTQLVQNTRNF